MAAKKHVKEFNNPYERLFYEFQPYAYIALAVYALKSGSASVVTYVSGVVLVLSAFMILHWRFSHRQSTFKK